MKERIGTALAAIALGATVVIGGAMAIDQTSKPTKPSWYGSPVASPVAVEPTVAPTTEPTPLVVIELPSTGTGSSR